MKTFEILIQRTILKNTECNKITEIKSNSIINTFDKLKLIPFFNNVMVKNPMFIKKGKYSIDRYTTLIIRQLRN